MKGIIIDFDEITDSSEVYDERPHAFFTWFVILIGVSLIGGIILMVCSNIEVAETVSGIIMPGERTYVEMLVSGYDASGIKNGMEVKIDLRTCSKLKNAKIVSGEIVYISTLPETYDKYGNGYYKVLARLNLTKNSVEQLNIKEGTGCQGKIVTEEKNVMKYILEKINIID